jgi:uncharacterized protein DUF3443
MTRAKKFLVLALGAACCFTLACGGGHHSNTIATSGANVQPITVNAGPAGNFANGLFTSITVCVPGSSTCQTIDGVLVDTGSSGLRILSSVLTVPLPRQTTSNGTPVVECLPFISGFTWGPVQTADVQISGEKAASVSVQVLSDTEFPVPSQCKNGMASQDTLQSLGANGILGVGNFAQDCGPACQETGSSNPGLYYQCPTSGCQIISESVQQQVQNPVAMFASDNNGVIIELPAVSAPEATTSGSLVFGIGTQSNNGLQGATVYTLDPNGEFTTTFKSSSPKSFIDSGSNGIFFLDSTTTGLPDCTQAKGFYCPTSTQNLSATPRGTNGASATINFSVDNAETLFSNTTNNVFPTLAGPSPNLFDWGLPFFFGHNVFTAIEGMNAGGTTGPYWAF